MLTTPLTVDSGTTAFFTATLQRADGGTTPPLTAFRTVYDITKGQEAILTPEESIPASSLALSFKTTDEENTIINPDNAIEKRRIAIRATFGVGDEFTDYSDYTVRRIAPVLA